MINCNDLGYPHEFWYFRGEYICMCGAKCEVEIDHTQYEEYRYATKKTT